MPSDAADRPREARLWEIVFPDHANHLGTLFGGQALAWMDKAAFVAATRFSRRTVVTVSYTHLDVYKRQEDDLLPAVAAGDPHRESDRGRAAGLHAAGSAGVLAGEPRGLRGLPGGRAQARRADPSKRPIPTLRASPEEEESHHARPTPCLLYTSRCV